MMDYERVRMLAESAQERADRHHLKVQDVKRAMAGADAQEMFDLTKMYHSSLNDYFYWIGHANAYRGVLAGLEIMSIVEDELEAESQCP